MRLSLRPSVRYRALLDIAARGCEAARRRHTPTKPWLKSSQFMLASRIFLTTLPA